MASSVKSTKKRGATSAAVFPGEERIKIQKLSGTKNAASLSKAALDANSEDALDELKCPICLEIPLEEIFQCGNGHPVCKSCQVKMATDSCAQCRGDMKLGDRFIRNLALEKILDKMWITCPFQSNGCKTILSRMEMRQHKHECNFNSGDIIEVCRHFFMGEHCTFKVNRNNMAETLEHFRYFHRTMGLKNTVIKSEGQVLSIYLRQIQEKVYYPKVLSLGFGNTQRHFLVIVNVNSEDDRLSFVVINLNKYSALDGEIGMELNLTVYGKHKESTFGLPLIPFEIAAQALNKKNMECYLRKSELEQSFMEKDGILHICFERLE